MDDSTPNNLDSKPPQKNACVSCARPCDFSLRVASVRSRKRPADEDIHARLHRYEELLRKNNIDFGPSDDWIHTTVKQQDDSSYTLQTAPSSTPSVPKNTNAQRNWWAELSEELKNPTEQLPPPRTHEDPPSVESSVPTSPETAALLFGMQRGSRYAKSHPLPGMIFKFWQFFLDYINPLIKVIHAPTMQREILKAMDNLQEVDKSLEVLLFSIYTIVVASISAADCLSMFACERAPLLAQFRNATQQALIDADFLRTAEFKVLQALLLFMLCDPNSEESFILSTVSVRLAERLGIVGKDNPELSFFENEMRLRAWWQIVFLDARAAMARPNVSTSVTAAEMDEVRLPYNVNDSELYPEMSGPPLENGRITDMVCCIMKYDAHRIMRQSKLFPAHARRWVDFEMSLSDKDKLIDLVDKVYQEKYVQHCDPKIPLHSLAIHLAKVGISRMIFRAHHPRNNPEHADPQESDLVFLHSVRLIEYDNSIRHTKFPQQLLRHLIAKTQLDALICVLTGLQQRTVGELVENAWKQIEIFYRDHISLVDETENTLYKAMGDLALKAWQTRASVVRLQTKPDFISRLLHKRNSQYAMTTGPHNTSIEFSEAPSIPKDQDYTAPASLVATPTERHPLDTPEVDWSFWDGLLADPGFGSYGQEILGYNFGP
ncbi:putative LRR receptor-like serine/threonine-protein kinase At1g51860 [Talaromyces islandicus]|uniref:Putative LRR receptor-like serine/threonine-protein kinase At1g51860 n=1 Tax=Talaromyces islandicus TaxID=28573 RepID=A0A0U1LUY2_TALIS|nr:putative LRR receptor-like serine/threonine-protein kinase At1g51860 [Talaromyces islandicus]